MSIAARPDRSKAALFRLTPGTTIKGKYRAPAGWQNSTPADNDLSPLREGEAMAMVCGTAYDVLDVDPRNGGSIKELARRRLIPLVRKVIATPSNGWHLYIDPLGVGKGKPLDGVDLQARGSFVLIPATPGYVELDPADWPSEIAASDGAADRLRRLLEAPSTDEPGVSVETASPEYLRTALSNEAFRVQLAPEGMRNHVLNEAAFNLGQLIPAGLDRADAETALTDAALEAGLEPAEIRATLTSGLDAGADRPRTKGVEPAPTTPILQQFPRLDLAELLNPNRPPRDWVVSGLIASGAAVSLVAPAGSMKSLLMLSLSLAVARGDEDFAGLVIPRPRRVLYVDMENTEDDLADRMRSLGVQPEDLAELVFLHYPRFPSLHTPAGGRKLLEVLTAYGVTAGDMVVLDSFQRVIQAEENDSRTYQEFVDHTGLPLKKLGITVLRTDNSGKDVERGARGSSSKQDDVDVELRMQRVDEMLYITPGKVRSGGVTELTVQVSVDEDDRLRFGAVRDTPSPRTELVKDLVARWVGDNPGASLNQIKGGVRRNRDLVAQVLESLVEDGYVTVVQAGQKRQHTLARPYAPELES